MVMRGALNLILNIVWLIFGGAFVAIFYALAGLICFVLIVTIPFGVAAFRLANYTIWPFGRMLVAKESAGLASGVGNVIWFVLFGWWLALAHVVIGVAQLISIIGIPLGLANFKLVPVSVFPLGHEVVPVPREP